MILPGCAVKVSQMLGPLPSSSDAPSIWYDAVLVPKRNPGGNWGDTRSFSYMSVEVRRGTARFLTRNEGRSTRHSFSFGPHYDPENVGFGPMVCHDDHCCARAAGSTDHPHSDLEIVTWVLTGALVHADDHGHEGAVIPGTVQVLSAGSGVVHAEIAHQPRDRPGSSRSGSTRPDRARPGVHHRAGHAARGASWCRSRPVTSGRSGPARHGLRDLPRRAAPRRRHASRCPTTRCSTSSSRAARWRGRLAEPLHGGRRLPVHRRAGHRAHRGVPDRAAWSGRSGDDLEGPGRISTTAGSSARPGREPSGSPSPPTGTRARAWPRSSTRLPDSTVTSGQVDVRAVVHLRQRPHQREPRRRLDHDHVEQPVVDGGGRGDLHALAVVGRVRDDDRGGGVLLLDAVDRHDVAAGLVRRERADRGVRVLQRAAASAPGRRSRRPGRRRRRRPSRRPRAGSSPSRSRRAGRPGVRRPRAAAAPGRRRRRAAPSIRAKSLPRPAGQHGERAAAARRPRRRATTASRRRRPRRPRRRGPAASATRSRIAWARASRSRRRSRRRRAAAGRPARPRSGAAPPPEAGLTRKVKRAWSRDQHPRVEDAGRVEVGLDRAQDRDADRRRSPAASHGLWSVPTAWWWVIVAPAAMIASLAAALAASHCASGSSASFAATVK